MQTTATRLPAPQWRSAVGEESAPQVERVVRRLAAREGESRILEGWEEVTRILHTQRHLPKCLTSACRRKVKDESAASALAVSFGASIFPHRPGDLGDVRLRARLDAHVELWRTLRSEGGGAGTAERVLTTLRGLNRLPEEVAKSADGWLDSLTAADLPGSSEERSARRLGAALYLGTCDRDSIAGIYRGWREEGDLVDQLGKWFPSPPSRLADLEPEGSGYLDRKRIRGRLERLGGPSPAAIDRALWMESTSRKVATRVIPPSQVAEEVAELWEGVWERLTSGFPYFAFETYLTYWWKQVVRNYDFHRPQRQATPEYLEGLSERRVEVSPELLRIYREGHRLVRCSFFALKVDPGDDPSAAHEQIRRRIDVLWREHLAQALGVDTPPPEHEIDEICETVGVDRQTFYDHLRHLRRRFWAYTLARLGRFTNDEIRHMRRPRGYGKKGASEYPLAKAPGLLPITTTARAILPRETLLFAFLSHVFFRHHGDSRFVDPWTTERFFTYELRYWPWRQSIAVMRRPGSCRAARHAVRWLDEASPQPLRAFLEEGGDLLPSSAALWGWIRRGLDGLLTDSDRGILGSRLAQDWRRKLGRHWVIPIWHLAVLEDLDDRTVIGRLCPDPGEAKGVLEAAREMRRRQTGGVS